MVLNGQKEVIWLANVTNSAPNSSAQLLDLGLARKHYRDNHMGEFRISFGYILAKDEA